MRSRFLQTGKFDSEDKCLNWWSSDVFIFVLLFVAFREWSRPSSWRRLSEIDRGRGGGGLEPRGFVGYGNSGGIAFFRCYSRWCSGWAICLVALFIGLLRLPITCESLRLGSAIRPRPYSKRTFISSNMYSHLSNRLVVMCWWCVVTPAWITWYGSWGSWGSGS